MGRGGSPRHGISLMSALSKYLLREVPSVLGTWGQAQQGMRQRSLLPWSSRPSNRSVWGPGWLQNPRDSP